MSISSVDARLRLTLPIAPSLLLVRLRDKGNDVFEEEAASMLTCCSVDSTLGMKGKLKFKDKLTQYLVKEGCLGLAVPSF